jgi:hypothetical protein
MFGDQNAGQGHNLKIDKSSSIRVEHSRYFGNTVGNKNCIQEEIKTSLGSDIACCHSV